MMNSLPRWTLATACLLVFAVFVRGQGSLTPPGAPGPTMKTLDQVEARIPLSGGSSLITIASDGSYYLTGNVTIASGNAINITANNVALDLNGYTILGAGSTNNAGAAVSYTGSGSFTLRNGYIRGTTSFSAGTFSGAGFNDAVNVGANATSVLIEGIAIYGVNGNGIYISAPDAVVSRCQTYITKGYGIFASLTSSSIDHCVQQTCNLDGITGGTINDCFGTSPSGNGINGGSVNNCTALTNTGAAILSTGAVINCTANSLSTGTAIQAASATNCVGTSAGGNAIKVTNTANGCTGTASTTGAGISAYCATNCQGSSSSGDGVDCTVANGSAGVTQTGRGLNATDAATGCSGRANSGANSFGLCASVASNCVGISQSGVGCLITNCALNCFGQVSDVNGLAGSVGISSGGGVVTSCTGQANSNALAVEAYIANGSYAAGYSSITHKYNMP